MQTSLDLATYLGISPVLLAIIIIWSTVWMALAMWVSARNNNKIWFVIFVLFHTLGILEILYIFVFSKKSKSNPEVEEKAVKKKRR